MQFNFSKCNITIVTIKTKKTNECPNCTMSEENRASISSEILESPDRANLNGGGHIENICETASHTL